VGEVPFEIEVRKPGVRYTLCGEKIKLKGVEGQGMVKHEIIKKYIK